MMLRLLLHSFAGKLGTGQNCEIKQGKSQEIILVYHKQRNKCTKTKRENIATYFKKASEEAKTKLYKSIKPYY